MTSGPVSILNAHEQKLIEGLRRHERRWPRWRWLALALGLGFASSSGLTGYALWSGLSGIGDRGKTAAAILLLSFLCVSQVWLALFLVAMVFRRHPTNSTRQLLLKLADALVERSKSD